MAFITGTVCGSGQRAIDEQQRAGLSGDDLIEKDDDTVILPPLFPSGGHTKNGRC